MSVGHMIYSVWLKLAVVCFSIVRIFSFHILSPGWCQKLWHPAWHQFVQHSMSAIFGDIVHLGGSVRSCSISNRTCLARNWTRRLIFHTEKQIVLRGKRYEKHSLEIKEFYFQFSTKRHRCFSKNDKRKFQHFPHCEIVNQECNFLGLGME